MLRAVGLLLLCAAAVHGQFDSDGTGDVRAKYQTCLDAPTSCVKL
jgi:hypothetical protein